MQLLLAALPPVQQYLYHQVGLLKSSNMDERWKAVAAVGEYRAACQQGQDASFCHNCMLLADLSPETQRALLADLITSVQQALLADLITSVQQALL